MGWEITAKLLGKQTGLDASDIEQFVRSRHRESDLLDAKSLALVTSLREQASSLLLKPAVAFLNKLDGSGGLLLLGFGETEQVVDKVEPATEVLNESQIRDLLLSGIGTMPASLEWRADVQVVRLGTGFIALVEVHPDATPRLYFSKRENVAYVRRGDQSAQIPLNEALEIANRRAHSRVGVRFSAGDRKTGLLGANLSRLVKLYWDNRGNRPGRDVTTLLYASAVRPGIKLKFTGPSSTDWGGEYGDLALRWQQRTERLHPLVYPGGMAELGELLVNSESWPAEIRLRAETHDEYGLTRQEWQLRVDSQAGSSIEYKILADERLPYM